MLGTMMYPPYTHAVKAAHARRGTCPLAAPRLCSWGCDKTHAPPPLPFKTSQVQEWKFKCEAIEKRESERREVEAKKHKDEVAYLENYAKQLKQQLETFLVPAKKGAPGAPAAAT